MQSHQLLGSTRQFAALRLERQVAPNFMLRSFRSAVAASFLLALVEVGTVQAADTLCSLPPVTYAKAKSTYPASAFAIEALEKYGIATWYSDRTENGDYAQTAADLVSACPEDSRISVVVYGLPNKDCAAKESAVGSTVHSTSDYVTFLNTLTSAIGNRKVLYILEPDAIGLLADSTSCGQSAGYVANLQTAIGLLSQNENADIYLDVGYWTLEYPATSTAVADIVKQLVSSGSNKVKGISLNTSNYQSTDSLSELCSNFQRAIGSTDLHCVFDTSRNKNGAPESNEWCNVKSAGIGALPTSATGISNVDYFIWAKPPGDSDGTCQGRTSDSMQGPGAGVFFDDLFQSLWNQGILVADMGFDAIDGTVHSSTTSGSSASTPTPSTQTSSASQQQQQQDQNQGQEVVMYNATAPSQTTVDPASSTADEKTPSATTSAPSTSDQTTQLTTGIQTSLQTTEEASTPTPNDTPTPESKASDSQQISTESAGTSTMGTGVIVLIALVAAAVVALVAIVGVRQRQKKMLLDAKTPDGSALRPLPTSIVDFRPQITAVARDSNIL